MLFTDPLPSTPEVGFPIGYLTSGTDVPVKSSAAKIPFNSWSQYLPQLLFPTHLKIFSSNTVWPCYLHAQDLKTFLSHALWEIVNKYLWEMLKTGFPLLDFIRRCWKLFCEVKCLVASHAHTVIQFWMSYEEEGWDESEGRLKEYYYMFQRMPFLPTSWCKK